MDRTKKLLMGVTASALLTGGANEIGKAAVNETPHRYHHAAAPQDKTKETADIISKLLYTVPEQRAMTLNELLARRRDLDRTTAQKALDDLVKRGEIRKTGDGSQYKPFRYYDKARSGVGG